MTGFCIEKFIFKNIVREFCFIFLNVYYYFKMALIFCNNNIFCYDSLASEIQKIQSSARDHFQKIFTDHEKLKMQLESQKNELELRKIELEKREAHNESERKKLAEEIEEV